VKLESRDPEIPAESVHGVSGVDVVGAGVVVLPVYGRHQDEKAAGDQSSESAVNESNDLHVLVLDNWLGA